MGGVMLVQGQPDLSDVVLALRTPSAFPGRLNRRQ
jgi:hypothetical protein